VSSFAFSKTIAGRYLWSKRSEAFISIISIISVLGVAIGVMVLNIVMAIMTGFEYELKAKIVGANSHVIVKKLGGLIADWRQIESQIAEVDGVTGVSAFTYSQALIQTSNSTTGLLVKGIEEQSDAFKELLSQIPEAANRKEVLKAAPILIGKGSGVGDVKLPPLVIGAELARSLSLFNGQPVSLLAPTLSSSPFGLMPKFRRFVVTGRYSSGLIEYERSLAYTNINEAQRFFRLGDKIDGFEVRVDDIDQAPLIAKDIVEALGGYRSGLYAQDWTETNKPLWDALRLERNVYFTVLLLIIIMASFSIITTLIMIVLEKRRDIAVLRTLGASAKSIARIFQIQGATIGLIGTVLGLILGVLGCVALQEYGFPLDERIFPFSTVPVRMEVLNFAITGTVAFLICCLATLYPAYRASRLHPSEVLRYE
jgi:lipoprotein-releasing system permease protein